MVDIFLDHNKVDIGKTNTGNYKVDDKVDTILIHVRVDDVE